MILNSLVPAIFAGDLGVHGDRGQLGSGAVVQVGLGVPDPGRRAGRRGEARLLGRRGSGRRLRKNAVLDVLARVLAGGADLDPAVGKRASDRCANGHLADEDGARGRARAHIGGLERGAGHRGGGRGGRREANGGAPRDRAPRGRASRPQRSCGGWRGSCSSPGFRLARTRGDRGGGRRRTTGSSGSASAENPGHHRVAYTTLRDARRHRSSTPPWKTLPPQCVTEISLLE